MAARFGGVGSAMSFTAVLALLFPVVMLGCMATGAVHVPAASILADLSGARPLDATSHTIVFSLRLPRLVAAAIIGSALSVAGLLFQGLFRNPLADPYIIGSSSGSVLGASVAIFWLPSLHLLGFGSTAVFAFAGAAMTVCVVYGLADTSGGGSSNTLLLAGFAVGTVLNSIASLLASLRDTSAGLRALESWLRGTVGIPTWPQLGAVTLLLLPGLLAARQLMHRLNIVTLGDEYAEQLGVRPVPFRVAVVVTGALLTAAAVALGGLIGFVGLMVPHAARMLLGPDNRALLWPSAIGGALFVMLADTLARTAFAPMELPVGILMAMLGGPFFLFLLRRRPGAFTD